MTLTTHENSEVLNLVQLLKSLEEVNERSGNFLLRSRSRDARQEPGSNRLVDPNQPEQSDYGDFD
jgi:hypothetical protein